MFGLSEIQRMNAAPVQTDPLMTVGELRGILAGYADSVVVAIDCENACEPHPLMAGARLRNLIVRQRRDRYGENPGRPSVKALILNQDEGVDLADESWYDDSDE